MMKPLSIDQSYSAEKPRGWLWLTTAIAMLAAVLMWPIKHANLWWHRSRNASRAAGADERPRPASPVVPVVETLDRRISQDPRWREQVFKLRADERTEEMIQQPEPRAGTG